MKVNKDVRRFDYGQLGEIQKTPQGFLMVPGFATRVGVFPYFAADGTLRKELRHPDDVFAPESLVTLKYAPVTIEHPPDLIDPSNVDEYRVGHLTERVEVNRDLVETDFIIEDQGGIDAVEKEGLRETSSGYTADIVEESGTFNGAEYDYRQKNIRYNHVAIVRRGRAGPEVRLRLDSADAVMIAETKGSEFGTETSVNDAEEQGTKTVVIGGEEVSLPSGMADIVQDMLDRYDELRAKTMQMEDNVAKRTDKLDADVSKPSPSPQVKVEQMAPDGRSSAGKVGPADKVGPGIQDKDVEDEDEHGVSGGVKPNSRGAGAKALADKDEDKKEDEDEKEDGDMPVGGAPQVPAKDYEGAGQASAAMAPADLLKKELEEVENAIQAHQAKKLDLQAKMDEMANSSMGQGEAKKMDSADVKSTIRKRVKLERQAEKLVPFEIAKKFDSWTDAQIMAAVIKNRAPRADLDGKSFVYLQSRFDSIVESEEEQLASERTQVGRSLLDNARNDSMGEVDPASARLKMIHGSRELWKQNLSANKK